MRRDSATTGLRGGKRRAARLLSFLVVAIVLTAWPAAAAALVERPVTVDGPSSAVLSVEGTALAADGTGGIVYLKIEDDVPHVFVVRRLRGGWSLPVRVDRLPYEASQARIAASGHGRLLVVWVSQISTVHGTVRRALYSAELGPGASSFAEPLVVDPNLGAGRGVEPSLAGTDPGRAIVAYRVVTKDFSAFSPVDPIRPLRPNDVLADIRVARYQGTRWSRLGAINRNPEASVPAPTAANGPRVGLANDGGAVVAWQERDQSAVSRIWARRVFGTSLGPVLLASPSSWEGRQVIDDADALALAVSPLGMAQVVSRIPGGGSTRLFANQLPPRVDDGAGEFSGPVAVDDGPLAGKVGLPAVAVTEDGKDNGGRVVFTAGSSLRTATLGSAAALSDPSPPPPPQPGSEAEVGQSLGGTVLSWVTTGSDGLPAVAVRQEGDGGVQTGMVVGVAAGDVSGLSMASNEGGDALAAFLQSAGPEHEVVAEGISGPPTAFKVRAPRRWVRPRSALLSWSAPASASNSLSYTVLLDGDPIASLSRRAYLPSPTALGSGVSQVQVVATDGQGQTVISPPAKLKVDGRPPTATATPLPMAKSSHTVAIKVSDRDSGLVGGATRCAFGDGEGDRRGRVFRHSYARAGLYRVRLKVRDRAGNAATLRVPVRVG